MKPRAIAALAVTALLAGGILVANDFGDALGLHSFVWKAPPVQVSPKQMGEPKRAALKTVTLKIDNMFCASCPIIVKRTLERVEGVREALVSFQSKTATVTCGPAQCDAAKLIAAVTEMGFPSTVIREPKNG